jgi:predicted Zn finger-like uncharacterized protein
MSISFACPECKAKIEVGEEHVGHAGQCPRCQKVIVIPSPMQPMPILVGDDAAPREEPKPRRRAEAKEPPARPRRTAAAPKQPAGPIWPWVVGVFGAVAIAALLFGSFAVLVFWRRPEPARPGAFVDLKHGAIKQANGVTVGRLEGQRAVMQNGVFQIRSELHQNDPFDLDHNNSRCKRYDIELIAGRDYILELETNQFDSELRIEDLHGPMRTGFGNRGARVARIDYRPQFTDIYIIYATSPNPAFGNFTLTIREQNRPRPVVP